MIDDGKHSVLGIRINAVDYDSAVARIVSTSNNNAPLSVSALAVHGVMTGVMDPEHRYRLNALDVITPDGQPLRWAMRLLYGITLPDRVCGPDLMLRICLAAAENAMPIFLFGSSDDVLRRLSANLVAKFPRLNIVGIKASCFRKLTETENTELIREIHQSGAKICFVGLGCPRQEVFLFENVAAKKRVSLSE